MAQEQARATAWQTLQRCHADVAGRYDRELRMYAGAPCISDEDCLTFCAKPALNSLKVRVPVGDLSEQPRQLLGRCHVPTASQHVHLLRCLVQRAGEQVLDLLSRELGLHGKHNEVAVAATLRGAPERVVGLCVGPFAPPGVSFTYQSCLAREICNWNHEVNTKEECDESAILNPQFCGCREGFCFQLSLKQGCVEGSKLNSYCHEARELLRAVELRCATQAATAAAMKRCGELAGAHSRMMRTCLKRGCWPPQRLEFSDERCMDVVRARYSSCHELCNVPSGPNPKSDRPVCYRQLEVNETAVDCYRTRGDAQLHFLQREDGGDLSLTVPQHRRPDYCSVRTWRQLASIEPARSRRAEAQSFAARAAERAQNDEMARKKSEGVERAEEVRLAQTPPAPATCDIGVVQLEVATQQACRDRQQSIACCLSPVGELAAVCVPCAVANTTVCPRGSPVQALWRPNMQRYPAHLNSDTGGGLALVDWDDGGTEHRQVPWVWVFTRGGVLCTSEAEGCAAHWHCGTGEYCFGCDLCAKAHGGNPPPHLCAPCPTPRNGACGKLPQCQRLQDGVGGECPPPLDVRCPCKREWSVRFQFPGAPYETSIEGCWYDVSRNYHWCEVDESQAALCGAERIVGRDRFIYWRRCTPETCDQCNCDCSKSVCMAYNIVPFEGRLPPQVLPGDLGQTLAPELRDAAGLIAPNCSDGSFLRVRGLCNFCVSCCATFCHSRAQAAKAVNATNATKVFDCTATDVTGCSDSPRGWVDSTGRSCSDYASGNLCTPGGQLGANWIYDPPRVFSDFATNGRSSTDACCACGGGSDCSAKPIGWKDPSGADCEDYAERGWCNRTGYGPAWDVAWGNMPLGTDGVDALSACCSCGGGRLVAPPTSQLMLVDNYDACRSVWPGRARFEPPPWQVKSIDHCRLISGVCMRKLQAQRISAGASSSSADDPRIYGLCEQRAFNTGKVPLREDIGRQLQALDQNTGRGITPLQQQLQDGGTSMHVDYWGNDARGMCFYRQPDPFGLFGGPRREEMPQPWLPPKTSLWDLFEPPGIRLLGWPSEFWRALPESQAALNRPQTTQQGELMAATSSLRAALAGAGVELNLPATFDQRLEQWQGLLRGVDCTAAGIDARGNPDMSKFRRDMRWDPARFADKATCETPRCDLDDRVVDRLVCPTVEGCTVNEAYCASHPLATREQGICFTDVPKDVARCDELGGVVIEGPVFDEVLGVTRPMRLCAMPHRPLVYCTAPGEQVKRCAHFDVSYCETDPMARLLGCAVGIRPCQTQEECRTAGRCSDVDSGLTWAQSGTCVVTPLDDDLLMQECDADGLCYSRLEPPMGMEVRWKHGLLDLLDVDGAGAGSSLGSAGGGTVLDASGSEPGADVGRRLRSSGRLNRTECEALQPGRGRRAIWLQRSIDILECRRLHGCCLVKRGGRCQLFSGPVVDSLANATEAESRREECMHCGGEWGPVFHWEPGSWRTGRMQEQTRRWADRRWAPANEWAEVVDIDALRQLFENAVERDLGQQRLNAAKCLLEPLMTTLFTVSASCGTSASSESFVDDGSSAASQLPPTQVPLGSVAAPPGTEGHARLGGVLLAWHEFSAAPAKALVGNLEPDMVYDLALEPVEYELAMAASQLALPGRPERARGRIVAFALTGETTTTPPPQYEVNRVDSGNGGYPSWLINEMVSKTNPQLLQEEQDRQAALIANAEARKQQRLETERLASQAADASSGLPAVAQALLLGTSPPAQPALAPDDASGPLDLYNETCRSTVANPAGQVVGQLLGDCVRLNASRSLSNALELCLPLMQESTLDATPHGASLGSVLDFARKEVVPEAYNMSAPPPLGTGTVPGQLASALWLWESGQRFGRLVPGRSVHTPLGLKAEVRWLPGGKQLCARVFHVGWTYCPIARLDTSIYTALPPAEATDGSEVTSLESTCPQLDAVLAPVQGAQYAVNRSSAAYTRLDMQVSDPAGVLVSRQLPPPVAPDAATCLAGQCLAMRGEEFQVVPTGAADCALAC